jgi:hypothetical protein
VYEIDGNLAVAWNEVAERRKEEFAMVFFFSKLSSETGFCECADALEAGFST